MKIENRRSGVKIIALFIAGISFFSSCKKDPKIDVNEPSPTTNRAELTKDSIFLYAKQMYYWNASLPTYNAFNPRKFATNEAELFALTQYSSNPTTGKPYEYEVSDPTQPKYSFIDDGSVSDQIGGVSGDFGFSVFFNTTSDLRVKYVYGSSPASAAGLARGYQIVGINGKTSLTTSDSDIDYIVDAVFGDAPNVNLTLKKPDGSQVNVNVVRATYSLNPILYTHVYTVGAKKVGYIVFNSFTQNTKANLESAFIDFASQGVTELVVDLRYNGGGSVETATNLVNLIAPSAQNGKVMFTTYFNETMQQGKATILKNQVYRYQGQLHSYFEDDYSASNNVQLFAKEGSLTINRVYFLVTASTASASELTINNLKPVMDVKVIGKQTYGKPVGFFAIKIDKLDMYIPEFETRNQQNVGGYYNGLAVDKDVVDDVTKDFGDSAERLLANALNYASTGSFISTADPKAVTINGLSKPVLTSSEADKITGQLDKGQFKGMVFTEAKSKK